jgi:hypothetical protein
VIPVDFITEWRNQAPWASDAQVEQDLILSRAVVAMFADTAVAQLLAFRGGTALYKFHLRPPARYSGTSISFRSTQGRSGVCSTPSDVRSIRCSVRLDAPPRRAASS